jgi:hypothetical protein
MALHGTIGILLRSRHNEIQLLLIEFLAILQLLGTLLIERSIDGGFLMLWEQRTFR